VIECYYSPFGNFLFEDLEGLKIKLFTEIFESILTVFKPFNFRVSHK
jgi:hypothetical protein